MSKLTLLNLVEFTGLLASSAPAPGGGSASAAAGAMGAGLLTMVVRLTLGKEKYQAVAEEFEALRPRLDEARSRLLELVDEDTQAYERIVAARALPKSTNEERALRQRALEDATVVATTTPLQIAFFACQALALAPQVMKKGNVNAASDALVAALLLSAATEGALANVRINLPGVRDPELARGFREEVNDHEAKCRTALAEARELALERGLG